MGRILRERLLAARLAPASRTQWWSCSSIDSPGTVVLGFLRFNPHRSQLHPTPVNSPSFWLSRRCRRRRAHRAAHEDRSRLSVPKCSHERCRWPVGRVCSPWRPTAPRSGYISTSIFRHFFRPRAAMPSTRGARCVSDLRWLARLVKSGTCLQ